MPRYVRQQTAFVGGEQSPNLRGRTDLEQYRFGCQLLRDATLLPQGGWVRRPGTFLIDKASTETGDKNFRLVGFTRTADLKYMLMFTDGKIVVYRGLQNVHEIAVADYTDDVITSIDTAQLADTMIITCPGKKPKQLRWNGSDVDWLLSDVTFDFIPQYFFNDASSPPGATEIQTVYLRSTGTGSTFTLALGGFETNEISVDTDETVTALRIQEELLDLSITPTSGIAVVGTKNSTSSYDFEVTFSGDAADDWSTISGSFVFRSDRPDQYIYATEDQQGAPRTEDVWSNTRGWPAHCAFFQNRLVLGNTEALPQNIWASVTGSYFDFNEGDGLDTDAIIVTIATNINNEIVNIVSSRELQVLTSNGEHYNPFAMTPSTFGLPMQTTNGSKETVRPQVVNGATYFIQRKGNGVREFVYTDSENAYASSNVALLSDHLIVDVIDTAQAQGIETDADYFYCLNADGTIAVMNVLRAQNISAWSMWEPSIGTFAAIGNSESDLYCVIKTSDGYYMCRFDTDAAMDMAQLFTTSSEVTLAEQGAYANNDVNIIADGVWLGEFESQGAITLNREFAEIEVGVNFIPRCIPNQISDNVTNGSNKNRAKRPCRVWVEMYNAIGVDLVYKEKVYDLAYRSMPISFENPEPVPFTGAKEKRLLGFTRDTAIEIRQSLPFKKAAVLSLQIEVKTV